MLLGSNHWQTPRRWQGRTPLLLPQTTLQVSAGVWQLVYLPHNGRFSSGVDVATGAKNTQDLTSMQCMASPGWAFSALIHHRAIHRLIAHHRSHMGWLATRTLYPITTSPNERPISSTYLVAFCCRGQPRGCDRRLLHSANRPNVCTAPTVPGGPKHQAAQWLHFKGRAVLNRTTHCNSNSAALCFAMLR